MTIRPEDLEDLLEAERDIDVPAPAQRQRMFARLEPLIVVPMALAAGASSVVTTADASAAGAISGFLKAKIAGAVISAALIGGAVGATGHAYFASSIPRSTPAATATPVAPPAVPSVAPAPARSADDAPAAVTSGAPAPSQSSGRQLRSQGVGSLRAERLLLETASAALVRGDTDSAILALRKHAQRFPHGALAEEREALLKRATTASQKLR
jgi:TolA-binding protein